MRSIRKVLTLVVAFVCAVAVLACGGERFTAAARSVSASASGIQITRNITRAFADEGEIAPDAELSFTRVLQEVNGSILRCAEEAGAIERFTRDTKATLLARCADISLRVARLQGVGVLQFKDEKSAKRLRRALIGLSLAAEGVTAGITLIPEPKTTDARAAPRPSEEGRAILAFAVGRLRENERLLSGDIERLTAARA